MVASYLEDDFCLAHELYHQGDGATMEAFNAAGIQRRQHRQNRGRQGHQRNREKLGKRRKTPEKSVEPAIYLNDC